MNLIKRNSTFDFPLFMDDFLKPDWFGGQHQAANNLPSVNIEDLETEFRIDFAVPGMKREDFAIEIDNNELSISSKTNSENETKTENYTRREFNFQSFKRVFTLPKSVNVDGIQANYVDGLLKVTLPKKEEALPKPKRVVEIG